MLTISAFTDGGYSSRTKKGGWAFHYSYPTSQGALVKVKDCSAAIDVTAQTMEITALLRCLQNLPKCPGFATIHSDSKYGVSSFGEGEWTDGKGWIAGWIKKGWKKADGGIVIHRKLFEEALLVLKLLKSKGMNVSFKWVPGHEGIDGNEEADAMVKKCVFG